MLLELKIIILIKNPVRFSKLWLCLTRTHCNSSLHYNWYSFAEVESRTQGSRPRPRPRTQKKSEAKAKDSLSEDRHSRGQGQECSRPRPRTNDTSASVLQKKRSPQKFFRRPLRSQKKKGLHKNFSIYLYEKTFSKKFFKRSTKF